MPGERAEEAAEREKGARSFGIPVSDRLPQGTDQRGDSFGAQFRHSGSEFGDAGLWRGGQFQFDSCRTGPETHHGVREAKTAHVLIRGCPGTYSKTLPRDSAPIVPTKDNFPVQMQSADDLRAPAMAESQIQPGLKADKRAQTTRLGLRESLVVP